MPVLVYDFVLARIVQPLTEEEDVRVETLFHDHVVIAADARNHLARRRKIDLADLADEPWIFTRADSWAYSRLAEDRKSTRLNSSHVAISYAVFCLKKKKKL